MTSMLAKRDELPTESRTADRDVEMAVRAVRVAASSALVGRTQRVVREQALAMQARRRRARSLWLVCGVCSALFVMLMGGLWAGLSQYELAPPSGASWAYLDSSYQIMMLAVWFAPFGGAALALVWLKRGRAGSGGGPRAMKSYRGAPAAQIVR